MLLLLAVLALAGCSGGLPGTGETPEATLPPTETPAPTSTPAPTVTPLPPIGALLVPEGSDADLASRMQSFLSEQIPRHGMRFQLRPSLDKDTIQRDEIQWVIAIPPVDGLDTLAASTPDTRFLAIGFENLEPAANLTVIAIPENWYLQQAFIAGYMGMVITYDWRVGMVRVNLPQDDLAAQAFRNGSLFFCASPSGDLNCYSHFAPVIAYPIIVYGEPELTPDEWPRLGQYLLNQAVETVFVSPLVDSDPLMRRLAQEEAVIIGTEPPLEDVRAQWAASLEFDLFASFERYWPEFVAGSEGQRIDVPLEITHTNPDLLSPGRQQFVEKMLDEVQAGNILMVEENKADNP